MAVFKHLKMQETTIWSGNMWIVFRRGIAKTGKYDTKEKQYIRNSLPFKRWDIIELDNRAGDEKYSSDEKVKKINEWEYDSKVNWQEWLANIDDKKEKWGKLPNISKEEITSRLKENGIRFFNWAKKDTLLKLAISKGM